MFITSLNAASLSIGDKFTTFTLPDQFEKAHVVDETTHTIIVSFEKSTGADINAFLKAHKPEYLQEHHAVFIANISEMPSLITKLFAMPKMKKYKHTILIINDEENHQFLYQEDKITVYTIENGSVSSVDFVDNSQEVEKKL
jgi:hypothetical protein